MHLHLILSDIDPETQFGSKEGEMKIGIIVGSTRPGRKALAVAQWAHEILQVR